MKDLARFLDVVLTSTPRDQRDDGLVGFLCLAIATAGGEKWRESWFKWPLEKDDFFKTVEELRDDHNLYFSSYLFARPYDSSKTNALPTRTIQADLDPASLDQIPIKPTAIIQTSAGHHQAFWVLERPVPMDMHETLSHKLTYNIPGADPSGWTIAHKMRIPDTFNHKYPETGPQEIKLLYCDGPEVDPDKVDLLEAVSRAVREADQAWLNAPLDVSGLDGLELWERFSPKFPARVRASFYTKRQPDRSAALWAVMNAGFRAGMTRKEVFVMVKGSANDKFTDLRYNGERELKLDVGRCFAAFNQEKNDPKRAITALRRLQEPTDTKRAKIAAYVLARMNETGTFLHTADGTIWYLLRDIGRPIYVSSRSEYLNALLDTTYGLNSTEGEQQYVVSHLGSMRQDLEVSGEAVSLSYYKKSDDSVLIHTGRKNVYRVTADGIREDVNGCCGVLFLWDLTHDVFKPDLSSDLDWGEKLFGPSFTNVQTYTREQALALLKVYTIFVLMRNAAETRPILALFGQPGSGKTTIFKRLYYLYYGGQKKVQGITTAEKFDETVINDPFVCWDQIDGQFSWLPDRLALMSASSSVTARKLYTDGDKVERRRQAVIGVTAHQPKFGRYDVVDRFLIMTFTRLTSFLDEADIRDEIGKIRDQLWGALLKDIQKVLQVDPKTLPKAPQFRVQDFAQIGWRIAHALGCADDFAGALAANRSDQTTFNLESDAPIIESLRRLLERRQRVYRQRLEEFNNPEKVTTTVRKNGRSTTPIAQGPPEEWPWKSTQVLWNELEALSEDPIVFRRSYKDAPTLMQKLWSMAETLKPVALLERRFDRVESGYLWRITAPS